MFKQILNVITILSVCVLLSQSVFVFAANEENADNDKQEEIIDDKQDELKKLEKKEKKYRDIINLKQKESDIINAQIKKLDDENATIEKSIKNNEDEIEDLTNEIERAETEIEQKENHISIQKKVLKQFIREKYQNYSKDSQHFILLNIANAYAVNHEDNISHATERVGKFVKTIHDEQKDLQKEKERFAEDAKEIEDAKYELEQRSEYLEGSKNYKRVLAGQVNAEEGKYQNRLSKVLEEQRAIQEELDELRIGNISKLDLDSLPDKEKGLFSYPVKKAFITQYYGKTKFANSSTFYNFHTGVDFGVSAGTSVYAVEKGKVIDTNFTEYAYGGWVAIEHEIDNKKIVTFYGHLQKLSVKKGEKIKKGEEIGKSGGIPGTPGSGNTTGAHLHFGVYQAKGFYVKHSKWNNAVKLPPDGLDINPSWYLP